MTELFDTHVHMGDERLRGEQEDVLKRSRDAGVTRCVEIADAPEEWTASKTLAEAHPNQLRCSLGLHPYYADQISDELIELLKKESLSPSVVAIGEIGLDYAKSTIPPDVQKTAFRAMLKAAKALDKPVVIHAREAYADLRVLISEFFTAPPTSAKFWGVIHCFSGTSEDAVFLTGLGFALGVDGPVTYPKNDPLRAALKQAGLKNMVLETDSPYLPPQSRRGQRNEPAYLVEIATKLAAVFEISLDDLARQTTENAKELFRL
jgi:TatD DNase family protein